MAGTPRRRAAPSGPTASKIGRFELRGELAHDEQSVLHIATGPSDGSASKLFLVEQLAPALAANRTIASAVATAARPLVKLRHDHVLPVLEVVERGGDVLVVTEYVESLTVAELLRLLSERGEQLPLDVALRVLVDTLRGLHAAHETRPERVTDGEIVHGSVDSGAVFVGVDGVARIGRLAVGRAVRRQLARAPSPKKGIGASPEEIAGEKVDRRTDVFATAALAWQCMVGRPLVEGDAEAVAKAIVEGRFDPPSQHNLFLPKPCDDVIMRGLEREPARRWDTAGEMAEALAAAAVVATPGRLGKWVSRVGASLLVARAKQVAAATAEPAEAEVSDDAPTIDGSTHQAKVPKASPPPFTKGRAAALPKPSPPKAAGTAQQAADGAGAEQSIDVDVGPNIEAGPGEPRGPTVVVEDESPTIGVVTRASEGARNFQAATTQRMVASAAGEAPKPSAPAVKVALRIDGAAAPAQAAPATEPDELPTLRGDQSSAALLASNAFDTAGAAGASYPGGAAAAPSAPTAAADAAGVIPATSEPTMATVPGARESFDELPTVEAARGSVDARAEEPLGSAQSIPGVAKRRKGLWIGVIGALAAAAAVAAWLGTGGFGGSSEKPSDASSTAGPAAATSEAPPTADGRDDTSEGATETDTGETSSSAEEVASAEPSATEVVDKPAPVAARPVARPTPTPPPTPPPKPPAAAKPKPTATKGKTEDDLFSRK